MNRRAQITGWGMYVPEKVLTNFELQGMVETTDEWIRSRTGIAERRIAAPEETSSSLATEAARRALAVAGLPPEALDMVIVATTTPDQIVPSSAAFVQHALGAKRAGAFDLNTACSGFVYALSVASQFIAAGTYRHVLVVGSEVYSRILNWQDRGTCILFGDGAGAVVLSAGVGEEGILGFVLGNDGSGIDLLYVPGPCGSPLDPRRNGGFYVNMAGQEVFRFAVNGMAKATTDVLAAAGLRFDDVALVLPHQANKRIISAVARQLRLDESLFYCNLEKYGNTSSASVPIALCEALDEGRIKRGDNLVMVAFGGGFSYAALALRWGASQCSTHREETATPETS
ncbi:MAG: ketoacyl-ACP synthase III [Chloroflexi bacterium]|nr:ketoacyl-ACP synthase III [Chloroflexota bacterium]